MTRRSPATFDSAVQVQAARLSLHNLIAPQALQRLQDDLSEINGLVSVITDLDGNALTVPGNPNPICRMIGLSEEGAALCHQNNIELDRQVAQSRYTVFQPCTQLGFFKAVIPIIINNLHLANWWVEQPCFQPAILKHIPALARRIGLKDQELAYRLKALPECRSEDFYQLLAWISRLVDRFAGLSFRCYALSKDLSRLRNMENELRRYKNHLEDLVQERTAELIKTNKRLQLEVMEKDMAEKRIARNARLLNAINQILQQTLNDRTDHLLVHTFLRAARDLTNSSLGFIVEHQETGWSLSAAHTPAAAEADLRYLFGDAQFHVTGIWRTVIHQGRSIMVDNPAEQPGKGLPESFPPIARLLVVPLRENSHVTGFMALANPSREYTLTDERDCKALGRAYIAAILRKRSELAKNFSEKRLNLAMESSNDGLWDYFPRNGEIYYSSNWFVMLGHQSNAFPESLETWVALTHPDDQPKLEDALKKAANGGPPAFSIEIRMLTGKNNWHWIQARGCSAETDAHGNVARIVGTISDISKFKEVQLALQKANVELQRLAALDGLTQIANRLHFQDRLSQEWRRARREQSSLALIICDIDFFKKFNDAYGHVKGDAALCGVAQAIKTALKRPMDLVARYGGEEFSIILPNTFIDGAEQVARDLKAAVDALRIKHKASPIGPFLSVSFGVAATVPAAKLSPKSLIHAADQALYQAKALGRDRIATATQLTVDDPAPETAAAEPEPFPQ